MVDIYRYLKDLNLNEILELLQNDNDIDNILVILQMYDINTLVEMEQIKEKIKELSKEDEEEDDLLEALDKKEEEIKKLQEQMREKEKTRENTRGALQSILEKPMDFWKSNEPSSFANSLIGSVLVPSTKEKRSSVAVGIINGIILGKKKEVGIEKNNSREQTIDKIIKHKEKVKAKSNTNTKEFVF
jgi:vacuolar-type H+-ATPase subunit I/STV1